MTDSYSIVSYMGQGLPENYRPYILSKWLRSLRHGNDYFRLIEPKIYYPTYRAYILKILDNPETLTRVAVLTDDRDVILGFSVSRGSILDYIHVLRIRQAVPTGFAITDFRRNGIGTKLLPPGIDTITHLTKTGMTIWGSKYGHWKFNPFA